jgi:glucose-1-phosphate thymidylyltransferase
MKGLILAGGHGTRLRPITYSQQKHLIPIANKPMLFYCIEDLIDANIQDISIIVGPNKEQVIDTVKAVKWDADIHFIYQEYPGGLGHAVKISQDFLDNDKFIMYLGDNLLKNGSHNFVKKFAKSNASASLLLTTTEYPERYGVALVEERERVIIKLIEKPKNPKSNLIVVGIYGFTPLVFEALNNIKPSWRNELEITDALQWLLDKGHIVEYEMVEGWWKDTGRPEDILDANRLALESIRGINRGKIVNSEIKGMVSIGNNTVIENNSTVKGPAIIGENCRISNAYIGPYTSLGNKCQVINTEIEDSIIMDGTRLVNMGKIVESLVGKDVLMEKTNNLPKGMRLVVGDSSQIRT